MLIEKQLVDARRRYQTCDRELNPGDLKKDCNPLNAARGFRTICDLLFAIIAEQRREIERLEREAAPLVRPQPKRVDCDGWSI